jgi:hypothetical protein
MGAKRVIEHRAERRDPRSACDEQQPPMRQGRGKGERSNRTLHVHELPWVERKVRARDASGIDPNEQFKSIGFGGAFRRAGNRIRTSNRLTVVRNQHRLPRHVRERRTAQVESHKPRARRHRDNIKQRKGDNRRHRGPKCTSVHNAQMARARRVRGRLLRLILNRPIAALVGIALASPAAVLLVKDYSWESGATDGVALVMLATGVAILWSGVIGRQPDWID